ncbi:riboflavin synthase [Elizabethkingia anophelis]|uniref:Riboflavin synthase n=3 Tax=Elizabethkingia anophelis TaxID=1117645 RepID=X5KB09_9FLAO|nr:MULTISPECIES: riboflavin synthase [Elizabethkingia]AIL44048.1 Riboflavin synthase eubacterial/eukaryotic [Elizabethkingia anophelis NUHP1]AQW90328.1 riboflavin synthase subunit alpha [Elizabethkingia anophelis]AQW98000.1 riboflavin synthase subunit alpha [Elizabethkingia anophelis]AQX50217.1 riboflavin synthase subunit alpha [Elizabethkingia anophelis]AQX88566.1 riboflavin synthase subunit alpha [Elizabethkingia anophelis]
MFTGIIEAIGKVENIVHENANVHFTINSPFTGELKIDQSVAHNGCCLTVVAIKDSEYVVTAIKETLDVTALDELKVGDLVNLERCMIMNSRLDGHIVQGHVDQTGYLDTIENQDGSYLLTFKYDEKDFTTVNKGSITVNGISLTVVNSHKGQFSVALIPYTWEHTNMHRLNIGDKVNLEFDIIGKYVAKLMNK